MEISEEQNVANASRAFHSDGTFKSAERYGSGHIHDTYHVWFQDGDHVTRILLQRLNTNIFKNPVAVMHNVYRVTSHVRSRLFNVKDLDRRVLQLIEARDGGLFYMDEKRKYWRAYRFIERAHTYDKVTSGRQAFEAANAFGEFQYLLSDLPATDLEETIPHFHDTRKRFTDFETTLMSDKMRRSTEAQEEIAFAMSRRTLASALAEADLPKRVTHNDTKLSNVLLDDETSEGICVIDLDTVMPGLVAYDFGDMVRTMTCSVAEDEQDLSKVRIEMELFEAVLGGYLLGAGSFLTAQEREFLVAGAKVIIFEQGIRFLSDFLAGDTYYRVNKPRQNLDRCRVQFKLLQSIEQQESNMICLLESLM